MPTTSRPTTTTPTTNVFLRDLDESTTALASRANGARGAGGGRQRPSFPVVSDNARVAFSSTATNLSAEDSPFEDVFVRDALADTTELVSRAPGAAGAAANAFSAAPTTSADGRYVAFLSRASNLVAGTAPAVDNIFRRDVLGDAPVAMPACKTLPLPPAPVRRGGRHLHAHRSSQLRINQRISQAAIRRLNAVRGAPRTAACRPATCAATRSGRPSSGPGITSAPAAASLAPVASADPAPIVDPGRSGPGDPLTLSATQLLINQRIDQAAIRRADGITNRLEAGLTGGDVRAGQVTQGKLFDRLQILAKVAEPPSRPPARPPSRPAEPARSGQRHPHHRAS